MLNINTPGKVIMTNSHTQNQQPIHPDLKVQPSRDASNEQNQSNYHSQSLFLTHQQKIQATYNFQHLFRKKSHLYNLHKNKKKLMNKGKGKQAVSQDDPDKDSKNLKKGHWNQEQNRKYHWFLQLNNKKFIQKHLRRFDKIFKAMSAFIGTRQAEQCRSHHQKMQKKFKHFYQIILKLRLQYYGTCSTDAVKTDLQQNGYIKQTKQLLIEENIMKEMQNTKDLQHNSEKQEVKNSQNEYLISMQQNHIQNNSEDSQSSSEFKTKKQGAHMLLGENYEQKFNYKMY